MPDSVKQSKPKPDKRYTFEVPKRERAEFDKIRDIFADKVPAQTIHKLFRAGKKLYHEKGHQAFTDYIKEQ